MIEQVQAPWWCLALSYMQSARKAADADLQAMVWVARHARQSLTSLGKMARQRFRGVYRHLVEIVSDEWSPGGE